ncbi:hypothetical protein KIH39_02080 [Telmatocola sphagniphila]|uniref:Uncharacterized protein n=1 Tax=Telmatocola sphagniphila TaxID=1123043 RepID=A0A8E6B6Q1_9BACT|nr:hypothetical protein [Telmatocola sphagniphila]QVL32731.1 hypothetical protein KIH39_02080 [Telmatocola sphagniphila]
MAKAKVSKAPVETPAEPAGKVNKSELFREAIAALSIDADVQQIIDWIKEKHGVELPKLTVYQYRALARKKVNSSGKLTKPKAENPVSGNTEAILDFVQTLRQFEGKIDAATMKKAIDVIVR